MGIILSSTVEETTVFHNPIDLSACSFGRSAHANYLYAINSCKPTKKSLPSVASHDDYFYNLDNIFTKLFNYTEKNKIGVRWES